MRKPEPWYWGKRNSWYVQIGKKQIKLGEDLDPRPRGKPKPNEDILREYYRVMATSGLSSPEERYKATVLEVCEIFLDRKSELRETTLVGYRVHFKNLASLLPGKEFATIRKEDVLRVIERHPKWKEGTKAKFLEVMGMLFGWARNAGYLDINPLAGWESPYAPSLRQRGITEEEFQVIIDQAKDRQFREVMMFMRGTGCRVGEVPVIEARHVDADRPLITLEKELHKTGRKTGKVRVLVMPPDVEALVRGLVKRYPKGPLFRNSRFHDRWAKGSITERFRNYRRRLGLSEDVVPHLIRHATTARLMRNGTPDHLVAKILGHASPATMYRTYYHPDMELMIDAVHKSQDQDPKAEEEMERR